MAQTQIECIPTQSSLRTGAETTQHVLVRVRAADRRGGARPRLTAVLAIDVSGSMQGQPLEHVVRSAERISELMADGDDLGVVAFSSGASTVSPLRKLDAAARRLVQRELRALRADGGTNISGGMAHGALLFPARKAGEQQILLLLSDGQPNVGTSTAEGLGSEAARVRERGVAVSTLGYGSHHDERVLIAIAELGGGRYAFVSEPQLAEGSFVRALGTQLDVVVEKPRLVLTPSEDADIVRVLGNPRMSFGADGLRIDLQDLVVGEERNIVVEMRVRAWREGDWKLLYASLSGREAGGGPEFHAQAAAHVSCSASGPTTINPEASAAASIALAAELRSEARAQADRGGFDEALGTLRKARDLLARTPGFEQGKGDPLDDAYDAIVDDIAVLEQRPDANRYAHYRKAQQDYLAFSQGTSQSSSAASYKAMSPSAQEMSSLRSAGDMTSARLVVVAGKTPGEIIAITKERTVFGRGKASTDVTINDVNVSRNHAMIERVGGAYWLVDMGSTNGVSVDGRRIARHQLSHGDVFEIGDHKLRFER